MKNKSRDNLLKIVQTGLMAAIIGAMLLTKIAFLPVVPLALTITLLVIPVTVGAILIGPAAGAFLGLVFGLASFAQCFGADPTGVYLFSVNPFLTFILCVIPRILMGFLVGLIFSGLIKTRINTIAPYLVASATGALLNTILFLGTLVLLFWNDPTINEGLGSLKKIVMVALGLNATLELIACVVIGTPVTKAVSLALGKFRSAPQKTVSQS